MSGRMPRQKPHRSVQDYGTPRGPGSFLAAVERRFGPIVWDLAAYAGNSVCGDRYFGPGSRWGEDSLERAWDWIPGVPRDGLRWLNPPFENIPRWVEKCAKEYVRGVRIAVLIPAAVSTNWYADWIQGRALALAIRPRLAFVGQSDPYPKDLLMAVYGEPAAFECWRWDETPAKEAAHG